MDVVRPYEVADHPWRDRNKGRPRRLDAFAWGVADHPWRDRNYRPRSGPSVMSARSLIIPGGTATDADVGAPGSRPRSLIIPGGIAT
ncbi:hypothetical protein FRAAL1601 [Frankia alni ACN14a]|uniref:Uncharacterized protein n=1 Tax=Frankia alni (strain DSM 45986 / CECT 9034 / ACN14a) TaxID=326424 RepID=Q0RQC0_FRAAA|nr:hypothetical protein FRAAL1601 [Frankia alni ACN14a]